MEPYPLVFDPVVLEKVWGGRALERLFGKRLPAGKRIGELWEVADLHEGESSVANGPLAGRGLHDVLELWGRRLLGDADPAGGRFPLLIKFLDANDDLSVQVHPTAEAAARSGGTARVKHEAWYVLEARGDAAIYRGLKPGVTPQRFRESLGDGTCPSLLNRVPAQVGQCHYLPSGTVHALGAGVVVAEIQLPSDTTYRVYDWGRMGADGRPRRLHVEQAMECIDFSDHTAEPQRPAEVTGVFGQALRICTCEYFLINRVQLSGGTGRNWPPGRMAILIVLEGRGRAAATPFKAGDSLLLPAGMAGGTLEALSDCTVLEVTLPERRR